MEKIKELIKEIEKTDEDWEKYKEPKEIQNPRTKNLINSLISEMREMIKQEREDVLKEIADDTKNPKIYNDMIDFSKHSLRHYYAWKMVKELEKANKEMIPVLFQNIMDKYVLRIEFDFQKAYSVYSAENEDVFRELLESYDTLTAYYVGRHFGRKSIIADIIEETEIDSDDAESFAELIERNYRELQLNAIIDHLPLPKL